MKKIIILINHFQIQDGVTRTAIGLANELSQNKNVKVTLCSLFKYDKNVEKLVLPEVEIKKIFGVYFRGFAKVVDLIPDSWLYRLIFRKKYDVEIGFCMTLPIKIVGASKNKLCKHYAWMHGYDEGLSLDDYYKAMDKVICVSKCNAERLCIESQNKYHVDYCYNLVDDKRIKKMSEVEADIPKEKELVFVAVGRLEYGKGFLRLIEIAGKLKQEGYLFKIWIIGDGEQYNELLKKVAELNLEKEVTFWGAQRNPYVYMSRASVLVCSSYSEGYSTVCTEAIMLGIPVLTTNVSGGKEIIEDAEAGLLVENSDDELYKGMKKILKNPELVDEWKETLLETKEKFSYEKRTEQMKKVLDI